MNSRESINSNLTETKVDIQHTHFNLIPFVFINKSILIFGLLLCLNYIAINLFFFNNLHFKFVFKQINSFLNYC